MDIAKVVEYAAIVAAIASGGAVVLTFFFSVRHSYRTMKMQAIIQYYQQGDNSNEAEARSAVLEPGFERNVFRVPEYEAAAERVCRFFHLWGLTVRKGYLPLWVFDSVSGERVVQLTQVLSHFILTRRSKYRYSRRYGEHFLWLSEAIQRKGYITAAAIEGKKDRTD